MSLKMKHSVYTLIIWSVVSILLAILFFSGDTINTWGDNRIKTLLMAALFLIGYVGNTILWLIFRKRKNKIVKDERDNYISLKSTSASYIATTVYIFILAISLYIKYESIGSVPVAWLWFIAYSLVVVSFLITSAFSLIYYYKIGK
ncbi:MAG: hypothetical protein KAH14_09600 [Clostridiales bacterium]|nr:hypothetical protein [Clostridiales bacterium]